MIKELSLIIDHNDQKKTVPLKLKLGNKTSKSILSGQQSKLSVPQRCGPPEEL